LEETHFEDYSEDFFFLSSTVFFNNICF
jgi:hypothetical protein